MATKKNTAEQEAPKVEETAEVAPEAVAEESVREMPETILVKTREGYTITGRKPTFGDRRWMFEQPEGMKLPASEVLPAACIQSVTKSVKQADGSMKDEPQELYQGVHPWFYLEKCGIEGPMVYMSLWNQTYMPSNDDMMSGMVYAMTELSKGNG